MPGAVGYTRSDTIMSADGTAGIDAYEPVIGLEVHAQLATESKMFCGCSTRFGAPPNTQTCPVCLGLPGALPVVNARGVDLAVMAALALGSRVSGTSVFARKHYFYPDLPKGYQITQHDEPLATGGGLSWPAGGATRAVRLARVHLEEDAGKSYHVGFADSDTSAYVDFNRSGVPLVEIVTEPDLSSPVDAAEFVRRLRAVLVAVGASDGDMEHGSLRCDVNVSVRRRGDAALGTRTEIKNLNSFRLLQHALEYEITRQSRVLEGGGRVLAETRLWDEGAGRTHVMRTKEDAEDYRYFPEPDLPPLVISPDRLARLRAALPELPESRRLRLSTAYGIGDEDAHVLANDPEVAAFFERAARASGDAGATSQWIRGELTRRMNDGGVTIGSVPVTPEGLARLITLVAAGTVSASAAKHILGRMVATGSEPEPIAAADGLLQESRPGTLSDLVAGTIARVPSQVAQYRQGKKAVAGFLVGQVIKESGGRANPAMVDELVRTHLDGSDRT
jgi:aspartyl-tRNA(Asn)/glutamyl-tRNA(Gln) amidotransferase subunit B